MNIPISCRLDALIFMLKKGADPGLTNANGYNVLHMLAREKDVDAKNRVKMAVKCLEKIGFTRRLCFVNQKTPGGGWTPLMAACEYGR